MTKEYIEEEHSEKWISVSDRMPEDDMTVSCWVKGQAADLPLICYYDEEEKAFIPVFCEQVVFARVDFWRELPPPPEE